MSLIRRLLFPDPVRTLPYARAWNIALRTAHIAVSGILVGGHYFQIPEKELLPLLYLCIASGATLMAVEAYPSCRWFYQGRGVMVLAKLALICAVPFLWEHWEQRIIILLLVVVIGSVGSHMPSRFRYYSLLHRRVLD